MSWEPRTLPAEFGETVRLIYEPTAESAKPAFDESHLGCLHAIIRLTVEFHHYLNSAIIIVPDGNAVTFACESIFSGIESFVILSDTYQVLVGSMKSSINWDDPISLGSLTERFKYMYKEFLSERTFERKCRLLLDLFELQIVFAGMSFD